MPNPVAAKLVALVSPPQATPNSTAVLSDQSRAKCHLPQDALRKDFQPTFETMFVEKPEPAQGLDDASSNASVTNAPETVKSPDFVSRSANRENPNHQGAVQAPIPSLEKVRYGAADGPRQKRRERHDGREPLNYAGHEAVAQFLAAPKSDREFKSLTALANHFKVTRMTIHRWKQDIDVMQRAYWLSKRNQMAGDLVARREYPEIMERAVQLAKAGDVQAMKFCESRAWPEELRVEHSQLSATVSVKDLFGIDKRDEPEELQDDNGRAERGDR